MHCGPYSQSYCLDVIQCTRMRFCLKGKEYVDNALQEWYAMAKRNLGQSEPVGPNDLSLNGTTDDTQDVNDTF